MDMLRVFFERSEEDTAVYFRDRKIWKCGKEYQEYQGKYPIIYMSLEDVKTEKIIWIDGEKKTLGEKEIIVTTDALARNGEAVDTGVAGEISENEGAAVDYAKLLKNKKIEKNY